MSARPPQSLQLGKATAIAVFTLAGSAAGFWVVHTVRVARREAQLAELEAERDALRRRLAELPASPSSSSSA